MLEYVLTKSQTFQLSYWNALTKVSRRKERIHDVYWNSYYDAWINSRYTEFKELSIAIIDLGRDSNKEGS